MTDVGIQVTRKIAAHLIWILFGLFVLSSLDRVNLGFAALQMNAALGLSPQQYGLAASIFFVGYLLFQIPSVLLLQKIGFRRWVTLIAVFWGATAALMAFSGSPDVLYLLRFLLGVAEAGFAPGVIYFLGLWLPRQYRGRAIAWTMMAIPISVIVGAPISGWLLTLNILDVQGWHWMFLIEGLATVILGLVCLGILPDRPEDAKWLTQEELQWLRQALKQEVSPGGDTGVGSMAVLASPLVWGSGLVWLSLLTGAYGLIFWLPQAIKQTAGLTDLAASALSALPWIGVAAGMILNARHSDLTQERHWHVGAAAMLAAAALAAVSLAANGSIAILLLVVAGVGLGAAQGVFWTIPQSFLGATSAAGGIALINLIGNVSNVVSPVVIGFIKARTGSFTAPLLVIAALLLAGGLLAIAVKPRRQARAAGTVESNPRG